MSVLLPSLTQPVPTYDGDLDLWAQGIVNFLSDPTNTASVSADINFPVKDSQGRIFLDTQGVTVRDSSGTIVISPDVIQIGTAHLVDAAITTSKLAGASVDTSKLANLAVDASKLASSSVTTTKIANAAVGSAAIATAAIGTAHIANAAITTALIGDGQILTAKIGDAQINSAKIANAAVNTINIANAAITSALIANANIDSAKISNVIASSNYQYTPGTSAAGWQLSGTQSGAGSLIINNLTVVDSSGNIVLQSGATPTGSLVDDIAAAQSTADASASTANWNSITGTGKPADNATVGAVWGSNLAGQPSDFDILNASVEVGSRNLLLRSYMIGTTATGKFTNSYARDISATAGSLNRLATHFTDYEAGYYTVSGWIKSSIAAVCTLDICDQAPTTVNVTTSFTYFKAEALYIDSAYLTHPSYYGFLDLVSDTTATITISDLKLEKGTKATNYSVAPEDIDKAWVGLPNVPDGATIGAAWASNVTGRPTELTDGRVSSGLDALGNVNQSVPLSKITQDSVTQHQGAIDGHQLTNGTAIDISGYDQPLFIKYPGGGYYSHPSGNINGVIQIKLPGIFNDTMLRFRMSVYNYALNSSFTVDVGGYIYISTGGIKSWVNTTAVITGNANTDHTVRFGHDGTNPCVWLGETTTLWKYTTLIISDFVGSFRHADLATWGSGWVVTMETAFGTILRTHADASVNSWGNAVNVPSNLASLTGSEAIKNSTITVNPDGTLVGAGGGQVTLSGLGFTGALDATAGSPVFYQTATPSTNNPDGSIWIHSTTKVMKMLRSSTWTNIGFSEPLTAANIATYMSGAAIGNAQIGNAAVGTAQIQDLSVSSGKIIDASIISAKIGSAAIQTAHIANAAIDSAKIGSAAVTTAKIADASISSLKISDTIKSSDWQYTSGVSAAGWRLSGTQTGGGKFEGSQITLYKADGTTLLDVNAESGKIINDIINAGTTADWVSLNGRPADSALLNSLQDWGQLQNVPEARLYANLMDTTVWQVGTTGNQGGYTVNGKQTENTIINGIGPEGYSETIWEGSSDIGDGAGADGGWNYTLGPGYDNSKSYLFLVWAKTTEDVGQLYLGCSSCKYSSTGATNNNPYFWHGDLPQMNKWYLIVGVLHGKDYTGSNTGVAGVYDPTTGLKVLNATEYTALSTQTIQRHRCYLYYSNSTTNTASWCRPAIYEINGSEPSLQSLMSSTALLNSNQQWEDLGNVPEAAIRDSGAAAILGFNPSFTDWSSTYPDGWVNWSGAAPTKETVDIHSGIHAARYDNVNATATGMLRAITWYSSPKSEGTYVKGSVYIKLLSVTSGAPGVLLYLYYNQSGSVRATKVTADINAIGAWQRLEFVARALPTDKIYGFRIYCMASYAGFNTGQFTGSVIFDSLEFDFYDGSSDNTLITMNSNGTLSNAGGGQVSLSGIGYAGDINATATGLANLVINGSAELENNKYFEQGFYDTNYAASGKGCIGRTSTSVTFAGSQWIPVDVNATYEHRLSARTDSTSDHLYAGLYCRDVNGSLIGYHECYRLPGQDSTLYAAAQVGDTTVKIVPNASAQWGTSNYEYLHLNSLADYSELPNKATRRVTAVDTSNPSYTLLTLSSGVAFAAASGSLCGRTVGGSTYAYGTAANVTLTQSWQNYSGYYQGVNAPTVAPTSNQFRIGTRFISHLALVNRDGGTRTMYQDEISFRKMPAIETRNDQLGALAALSTINGSVYINSGSIVADLMAADSVLAIAIAANAVTTSKLAANAVTAGKIAANTITANEIASSTITAAQIAATTITASKIAANTITAAKIASNTITANEIAANTITASQIASATITAGQIASGTITATQIAAATITAAQIAAGTITASKIATGTITATQIAAATITAAKIAAGTITASQIAANTITAAKIAAGTITANELAANSIQAQHLAIGSDGTETGNTSGVSMVLDPFNSTPISIVDNATSETVFAVQLVNGSPRALVSGTANQNFVDSAGAITDSVKKAINKYYLGGSGTVSATPGTMTSGATKSFTHTLAGDGIVNLAFKLNVSLFYSNILNQNYTAPQWKIEIFRGTTSGTLIYNNTFTGTASNVADPDFGGWTGSSNLTIDEGYVDTGAGTSGTQVYTLRATRISGTPTSLSLTEFSGDAPSFEVNTLDTNSSGGYSWRDKDTGFTMKSGRLTVYGSSTATVTFTTPFTTIYSVTTGHNVQGTSWHPDTVYSYSNNAVTIKNNHNQIVTVHWQATGYTA